MRKLETVLFVLVYLGCLMDRSSAVEGSTEVLDIIKVAEEVVVAISKAWHLVDQDVVFYDLPIPILDKIVDKLFGRIEKVNEKLDKLGRRVDEVGTSTIAMVLRTLPDRVRRELRLNDLLYYIGRMNLLNRNFQNYVKVQSEIERLTLEDFAKFVVSTDGSSMINLVERIHAFIAPNNQGFPDTGLMKLLLKALQEVEGDMLCSSQQSLQQVLYNLFNAITLAELKGYTMIQFSYVLLRLYDQGNFTKETQLMRNKYETQTNNAIEIVRHSIQTASRELWNCDPKKHVRGETYEEITRLLQGYVENEVDLNSKGTCRNECKDYDYTKNYNPFRTYRQKRVCYGKILHCEYFSSKYMWIYPAVSRSDRRYEYIKNEYGKDYGRKESCNKCGAVMLLDDSKWWQLWDCSYCFCLCDQEGGNSDRYFSMRQALADIANNKVVTGLRLLKKNRIIHLQIQEGTLLPRGKIDADSVHWVPVEEYKVTDGNIFDHQDYHTLRWDQRAIDLDDLEADEGYVLTGIRFKEIGSHLNLEIYITPFDFDSGKLINPSATSFWKDNATTDASIKNPRTKVLLRQPDIPTRSRSPSIPTSKSNQYIEFVNSDIYRDAAQTTVPFLDIQKVELLQPVPLSGAGIFHKGWNYFGGFITPKIITYDFAKHLKAAFHEEEVH